MPLNAEEQLLLELINRARLDPLSEAARFGIDLNAGLTPGRLDGGARQVLAGNEALNTAATDHSLWMLSTDTFSHTGFGGSSPGDRAETAGYDWSTYGENISWSGTSASGFDVTAAILAHHEGLFRSSGHRLNLLNDNFREVGLGRETGLFFASGRDWNASMLTELFGASSPSAYVTGVAYSDSNLDRFYSVGEGVGGVSLSSDAATTATAVAGGYQVSVGPSVATGLSGLTASGVNFALTVDTKGGSVKLDIVNGNEAFSSASLSLTAGLIHATLLGIDDVSVNGTAYSNRLTGNSGANFLRGQAGDDTLVGDAGDDSLFGGSGNDRLDGGAGADMLAGGLGNDVLIGGNGADRVIGGHGFDLLTGGADADGFVFFNGSGSDTVTDFSLAQGDRLHLDDALWAGTTFDAQQVVSAFATVASGGVVFNFGGGDTVLLQGVSSLAGLADGLLIG